jgi:hypothetical protein
MGAVYVVLADGTWAVARNRYGRDCARSLTALPSEGKGRPMGQVPLVGGSCEKTHQSRPSVVTV